MRSILLFILSIVLSPLSWSADFQKGLTAAKNGDFATYTSYSDRPIPENSLAEKFPQIASQWDYQKNAPLTPYDFTYGSQHRAWWLCPNGHSFDAIINSRTHHADGSYGGCRYCAWERKLPLGDKQDDLFSE
jgi:hypothetical protein